MKNNINKKGFLGILPQMVDLILLFLCVIGFVWLQLWALPRQPAFMVFVISLEVIIFLLTLFKPAWGLFLMILVIPGITTSTLTVFNRIYPSLTTGVFGPTALLPTLAFVFGVWLRTNIKKEELQPNYLRNLLITFMGLTILSAVVAFWRYSSFWPFTGWEIIDKIVNIDNLTSSKAKQNVIWVLVNYLTGPLLFLSICQASFLQIKKDSIAWKKWILKYIYLPFFVGSIAPIYVAFIQNKDIWFGAHKFYIWPWMNRINATFFDPNALGSYVLIAIPMTFAAVILLKSIKRWLIYPALLLSLGYIFCFLFFIGKSGSRMSLIGNVIFVIVALSLLLFITIKKLKKKLSLRKYRLICVITGIIYLTIACFFINSIPYLINKITKSPKFSKLTIVHRFERMKVKSIRDLYSVIKKDRGVHARIAVQMIKEFPLTGVGLGAFIAELPNYRKITRELVYVPDTACNYYLQIGSEQGLITLAVILLIFAIWYYKWWRVIREEKVFLYWIFVGAGFTVFVVMFLFGTHTLAHEIQCLYWVFLSQPFIAQPESFKKKINSKYLLLLLFIICVLFVSTTVSKLSLEKEQQLFGWKNKSQFYSWERWPDPNVQRVRYTKKESSEIVKCRGIFFIQKWAALYPDITKKPVKITFQLDNIITNIIARDNKWHTLKINTGTKSLNKKVLFSVSVNRTWKASSLGMNSDNRRLGILLNQFSWKNSAGMYKEEKWDNDNGIMANKKYRWTTKHALMLLSPTAAFAKMPMLASHPDINKEPVKVKLSTKDELLAEITFTNNLWQEITLFSKDFAKHKNTILHIDVSRTMTPKNYGIDDERELGVAVGSPSYSKEYGFYNKELWNDQFYYSWAKKKAGWVVKSATNNLADVYYMLGQPDITNHPITISFYLNDKIYKKEKVNDAEWRKININLNPSNHYNKIEIKVDKTWCPNNYGLKDSRELGFAIRRQMENF